MEPLIELKFNVFKALEDQMSLEEFEKCLYGSEALADMMDEDFVLDAFAFNYKQDGAKYQFEHSMSKYLDQDEFMLWKVKSNLSDLIAGKSNRDRILYDFYQHAMDEYSFLWPIGFYMEQIEDIEYYGNNLEAKLLDLRDDSEILLREIEKQEREKPGFRLKDYRVISKLEDQPVVKKKEWWKFWKS